MDGDLFGIFILKSGFWELNLEEGVGMDLKFSTEWEFGDFHLGSLSWNSHQDWRLIWDFYPEGVGFGIFSVQLYCLPARVPMVQNSPVPSSSPPVTCGDSGTRDGEGKSQHSTTTV